MSEYIEVGQPLQFTDPNTPTRVGEIVENVGDIYNIPSPRVGMRVFVKSEKKSYVITSLKSKVVNGLSVPNAQVEAFRCVEDELIDRIQGKSKNSDAVKDPFKFIGNYDGFESLMEKLDTMHNVEGVTGSSVHNGHFRALVGSKLVEIVNEAQGYAYDVWSQRITCAGIVLRNDVVKTETSYSEYSDDEGHKYRQRRYVQKFVDAVSSSAGFDVKGSVKTFCRRHHLTGDDISTWTPWYDVENPYVQTQNYGKKIALFGASFAQNMAVSGYEFTHEGTSYKLADYIAEKLGAVAFDDYAVGGQGMRCDDNSPFPVHLMNQLKTAQSKGIYDIYIIMGGVNDYWCDKVPLGESTGYASGSSDDEEQNISYCGGLLKAIDYIRVNAPNAKIYTITPFKGYNAEWGWNPRTKIRNAYGNSFYEFVQAQKEVAQVKGVPCLDLWAMQGFSGANATEHYISDLLHPNGNGYYKASEKIVEFVAHGVGSEVVDVQALSTPLDDKITAETQRAKNAEQANRQLIADLVGESPETLDTIHEISSWILNDETGAAAMAKEINENRNNININKDNIANNSIAIGEEEYRATKAETRLQKNIDNTNNIVGIEEKGKLTIRKGAVVESGSISSTSYSAYTNEFEGGDIAITNDGYLIYDARKVSVDGVAEMVTVKSRRLHTEKGYTYQLNISKNNSAQFSDDELEGGIVVLYNYDSSEIEKNKTDIQYLFEEAVKFDSFEVEELGDGIGINYDTFDGNSGSIEIPFATKEKAGVMSAEYKKVIDISKLRVADGKFTQQDYAGIYCSNVNTGNISTANSASNGIIISVNAGDVFKIIGENLKYGIQSVQFYSDYPSLEANVSNVKINKNKVTAPQGAKYMLVSVNPSLGTETVIKQLIWISTEDLPQNYKEVLDNIGSEYKTQVINVTQGIGAGDNRVFPISLLSEGDTIQIYVESDIDVKMSLVTFNGHVIQSIITNQILIKEITANDITGDTFGFYINSTQATQSGTLNCYLRIVKKDSSPTTLSKALLNVTNAPKNISDINKNLGSYYQELMVNIEAGKLLDARDFIFTDVAANYIIEFIAECDQDIVYRVLTTNGKYPFGDSYFSTNVLYRDVCGSDFITSLQAGKNWGVYIPADKATVSTTLHLKARIISNDTFSLQHTIDNTKKQADSLEKVVESVMEIPINNKNIKNWDTANKLVTRLYVENKERALADGLFVRQFFRALNSPTNNGFNFGTRNTGFAITIAPGIGDFDYYETTHATYGKIAIKIADWDAIEWPASGAISIGVLSESNLEDIVFDWNEFVKPLYPIVPIVDGSVTENKLSEEVKDKLNNSAPPLSKYELFSLGDSLSAAGIWQTKVAQLTGCTFDQSKNVKPGAMLSVGGTYSYGDSFDTVLWRAKNLIDKGYIADDGENAIVILENVNDGYVAFDEGAKSLIPTDPIEGYALADFGSALLESIADKAMLNAVLRLTKTQAGKNLKITTLPTKAGTITLRVGWAGPGVSTYNIQVEPKSTSDETLIGIIDKIMEYAYTGVTDTLGDDGASVDFCSSNPNYMPTVEFNDTGNTGMRVTITDNPNAKGSVAKFFIGDSVEEWTDTSKWVVLSYSQGWKSTIELLQRTYPKLHIFVSQFPMHSVTASEYLLPNGSYDTTSYNKVSRMETMRKMEVELKKIADFYSLPFLNVFRECGIGINNMLTYYNASANVHPKNEGYYRFGETVATQLKRYLP